ncbi:MAG: hypothetical protein KJ698_11535 [Actinobacteria bacterium]|nr:hypothetical protein [Actinomycetota bacterium]
MKRDIQFARTIETPYERVRDRLRDEAAALFGGAGPPLRTTLAARLRGTEISRDVTVEIIGYDEPHAEAVGAHLMFSADAALHGELFPHLEARIDAIPVADERTSLALIATYKPPLGVIGGAVDTLGLHHLAEHSLGDLFERIVSGLEG